MPVSVSSWVKPGLFQLYEPLERAKQRKDGQSLVPAARPSRGGHQVNTTWDKQGHTGHKETFGNGVRGYREQGDTGLSTGSKRMEIEAENHHLCVLPGPLHLEGSSSASPGM